MSKLIVANWKMNPQSPVEAEFIFDGIAKVSKNVKDIDIVICPPFPFLFLSKKIKNKNISLGAQNLFYETEGAYTGQVSSKMLSGLNAKYVIVGHSESRKQGDTNEIINKKIISSLKGKISPILCIGEKERDSHGEYLSFLKKQIHECLALISKSQLKSIIIAYEPIWAIGANATREATCEEFIEIRIFIKRVLSDLYGINKANQMNIIYGGSVHPDNAKTFIFDGGAGGLLVGRDSLIPKKFGEILGAIK